MCNEAFEGWPLAKTCQAIRNFIDGLTGVAPHAALVERWFDYIRHVHMNELDGRHLESEIAKLPC
jgi:hypothetical protein